MLSTPRQAPPLVSIRSSTKQLDEPIIVMSKIPHNSAEQLGQALESEGVQLAAVHFKNDSPMEELRQRSKPRGTLMSLISI